MTTLFSGSFAAQESSAFFQQASSGLSPLGSLQFQTPVASSRLGVDVTCTSVASLPSGQSVLVMGTPHSVQAAIFRTPTLSEKNRSAEKISILAHISVNAVPTVVSTRVTSKRQTDVFSVFGFVDGSVLTSWVHCDEPANVEPIREQAVTELQEPVRTISLTTDTEERLQFVVVGADTTIWLQDAASLQNRHRINLQSPAMQVLSGPKGILAVLADRTVVGVNVAPVEGYQDEGVFSSTIGVEVERIPAGSFEEGTTLTAAHLFQSPTRGALLVGAGVGWWGTLKFPPQHTNDTTLALAPNRISLVCMINEDTILFGCGNDLYIGSSLTGIGLAPKPLRLISNFSLPISDISVIPSQSTPHSAIVAVGQEVHLFSF